MFWYFVRRKNLAAPDWLRSVTTNGSSYQWLDRAPMSLPFEECQKFVIGDLFLTHVRFYEERLGVEIFF
jgi:hypothetical protein